LPFIVWSFPLLNLSFLPGSVWRSQVTPDSYSSWQSLTRP
jgi:hypothetical protein